MTESISLHTNNIYKQIQTDIEQATTICFLTSFVMDSGVALLYDSLQTALDRGAEVKIVTGDYLFITQPKAIKRLLQLHDPTGNQLEVRMWKSDGISFHPKVYITKKHAHGSVILGSSNMSKMALTQGIEWNVRLDRDASVSFFDTVMDEFMKVFYGDNTIIMNPETVSIYEQVYDEKQVEQNHIAQKWTAQEELALTLPTGEREPDEIKEPLTVYGTSDLPIPRQSQREALQALEDTVSEDYQKSMVVMATGLGKTYLAAFFSRKFTRVLFVAHREEILKQAKQTFEHVLGIEGGLYYGVEKAENDQLLFASIYTLSSLDHLHQFNEDAFDLIVIDEFHHAAAKSYTRILEYFKPQFLLGLTATPERTDGKDVFALCDGNVSYEINFIEAIKRGWLSPFSYHGVKDDIDYSQIRWLGNKYDEKDLRVQQLRTEHATLIYTQWIKHKQTKTIGFCSSIEQAEFLASYFKAKGIKAIALTSQTRDISRADAIKHLSTGLLECIFTVDLFNEGVDIPKVDTLLFARPTESLVVFTQQIGRGLRLADGKDQCVIIDLIGNYRHADTKLRVFSDDDQYAQKGNIHIPVVPDTCEIHIETEVINLLKAMRRKRSTRKERIFESYITVKNELGTRPTYRQMHLHGTVRSQEFRQAFGGYFSFLYEHGELNAHEEHVYEKHHEWLKKVESETMTKSYKMVVLQYILDRGSKWILPVTPEQIAPYFHNYYLEKEHRKQIDFSSKTNEKLWEYNEQKIARLIVSMPMRYWISKDGLMSLEDNQFGLTFEVLQTDNEMLRNMTQEICTYKLDGYFERRMERRG